MTRDTISGFVQSEFMEVPMKVEDKNICQECVPGHDGVWYDHLKEAENEA